MIQIKTVLKLHRLALTLGVSALALLTTTSIVGQEEWNDFPIASEVLPVSKAAESIPPVGGRWQRQGPAPMASGGTENVPGDEVNGAVEVVIAHPTDADVLWIGTVSGGVWKTSNATAAVPHWQLLTQEFPSAPIGAMALDPTDLNTLVAGMGRTSSSGRQGSPHLGLLISRDGGATWALTDGGGILRGKHISGVVVSGSKIVVSVSLNDSRVFGHSGIYRSTDGGQTFTQISAGNGSATGLPQGLTSDLVVDPMRPNRLFTAVSFAGSFFGESGVYRSDDFGRSWVKVSDALIDEELISAGAYNSGVEGTNIELAVGWHNNVWISIYKKTVLPRGGSSALTFRSGDGGATWSALGKPITHDKTSGISNRLQEHSTHPGSQGPRHFSLAADPIDPNIVYIGGDRQPILSFKLEGQEEYRLRNELGAEKFSGRLFRGDASRPEGEKWLHLTHRSDMGPVGGGTASSSAPHADSRDMVFDAAGNLIEVNDGGVAKRTSPRDNTGDWFSLNGDLQLIESHSLDYDALFDLAIIGLQDNGTGTQTVADNSSAWFMIQGGDGGDVVVQEFEAENRSRRLHSSQFLSALTETVWGPNGPETTTLLHDSLLFSDPAGQFRTPLAQNAASSDRVLVGGGPGRLGDKGVFESMDRLRTFTRVEPPVVANVFLRREGGGADPNSAGTGTLVYGATNNPDAIYVGSGADIYIRTEPAPAPLERSESFPGSVFDLWVNGVDMDPSDYRTAFAVNYAFIYMTRDGGETWTELSGNIRQFTSRQFMDVAYVPNERGNALVVASNDGIFLAEENSGFSHWRPLGTGADIHRTFELHYDATDDVLFVGTMGLGVYSLDDLAATAVSDTLYGAFGNGDLFQASTTSGDAGVVGSTALQGVTAAAREGNTLYLVTGDGDGSLYRSSLEGGSVQLVGQLGGAGRIGGLDSAPETATGFEAGSLYGVAFGAELDCLGSCLVELDPTTGERSILAPISVLAVSAAGFHPQSGEFWIWSQVDRAFYTVDISGGLTLQLSIPTQLPGPNPAVVDGLTFSCGGQLFVVDSGLEQLTRVEQDTGELTFIGALDSPGTAAKGLDGGSDSCTVD